MIGHAPTSEHAPGREHHGSMREHASMRDLPIREQPMHAAIKTEAKSYDDRKYSEPLMSLNSLVSESSKNAPLPSFPTATSYSNQPLFQPFLQSVDSGWKESAPTTTMVSDFHSALPTATTSQSLPSFMSNQNEEPLGLDYMNYPMANSSAFRRTDYPMDIQGLLNSTSTASSYYQSPSPAFRSPLPHSYHQPYPGQYSYPGQYPPLPRQSQAFTSEPPTYQNYAHLGSAAGSLYNPATGYSEKTLPGYQEKSLPGYSQKAPPGYPDKPLPSFNSYPPM